VPSLICSNKPEYDPSLGVFISLGSNQNYREMSSRALLLGAIETLRDGGDLIVARSSFWQSDAWPAGTGAPDFINAVCRVQPYDDDPAQLLSRLHAIEAKFGRQRDPQNRWSSRTLDLDLLDYNGLISENNSFPTLPHPRIAERDFVLKPLLEVSSNWVHPVTKKMGQSLLFELEQGETTNNCLKLGT
jgi:2-amino-4-hydroxy-6-hydroxymethyldihydropteridine diphosphokinase